MELGNFQKSVDSDEIKTMAFEIIGEPVKAVSRICEQWFMRSAYFIEL